MVSGSVVHRVIEECLKNGSRDGLEQAARTYLTEEFGGEREKADKYLAGVLRAVSKVPDWVWDGGWHVEEKLEQRFWDDVVVGKPDLFRVTEDEVRIVEFKTTETDPLEFLLWNSQHRYYAVLLDTAYPGRVVSFQYVTLPTTTKKAGVSALWTFSRKQLVAADLEIRGMLSLMATEDIVPSYGRSCSFCDFVEVCQTIVTGGDSAAVLKELYVKEEG